MSLLRLGPAAEYIGVHPVTLRRWADEGRVAVTWVGRERRFDSALLDAFVGRGEAERPRREALYVRVSGTSGQETSLVAQEAELRATAAA
ncbi:excisionase family DNA-binding protein, partial [Micromonospora sp. ATA51]